LERWRDENLKVILLTTLLLWIRKYGEIRFYLAMHGELSVRLYA
jgi:hypothetical protein